MNTPRAPGGSRRWLAAGLALVLCLLVSVPIAQTQAPRLDLPPLPPDSIPAELCGTDFEHLVSLGLAVPLALTDGEALMFDQTPAILKPDHSGNFSIKVQLVGDFPTMRFERETSTTETPVIETWARIGTRTVSGRIVSIFEKVYPDSELAATLRRRTWGFDNGGLYWGRVLLPSSEDKPQLTLRIGSTNLPGATPVVRLSADVQYAGSVVNIVIPGFGDSRVADGDHGFDLKGAAKKFYEFFPDSYDMIAFIPQSAALTASYSAFHQNVKNDVTGIGLRTFDASADYGSAGALLGVEVYPQHRFTNHSATNHEVLHQWGHYLDLTGLAGVTGQGHQPTSHTPLTTGGTQLGAVLEETRRVVAAAGSSYEIQLNSFPILHHPLEMYVLGKISPEALGTQLIFEDQGQFNATSSATPAVGTKVAGGVKEVTVGAILGKLGRRSGPSPSVIRRATVLVSRDAFASQAELDYWNFFAQRMADPNRTGVPDYDGNVSFERATQNTVDLMTDVAPKTGGAAGAAVDVTTPRFGRRDWRGLEFDDTVPSRFVVGQRITLAGRITATENADYNNLAVRFWKYGGNTDNAVLLWATVTRSGTFTANIDFTATQRGIYLMEAFLYWPGSSTAQRVGQLSPILVE